MNTFIDITPEQKQDYNKVVSHPLQSYEWGEFRKKTNIKVIRRALIDHNKIIDGFTLTIHKIPFFPYNIGYLPKGNLPTDELLDELYKIGKQEKCIYIQLEPNVPLNTSQVADSPGEALAKRGWTPGRWKLTPSFHSLFTRYTFILDLTKSEDELLKNMHPKTRYNIKVAQKHGVEIVEDNSDHAFETYLKLTQETTRRQKFYAHDEEYHKAMWETLQVTNQESGVRNQGENKKIPNSYFMIHNSNKLTAHLLLARYRPATNSQPFDLAQGKQPMTLVTWIVFVFKDTLYYPYGASSTEHREVMASNLLMWEAIRFGKKLGLKKFDMWGALGPNPDPKDPWYGFHRFKEGYGGKLVELVGSYDLVINPTLYTFAKTADKLRWSFLRFKKKM